MSALTTPDAPALAAALAARGLSCTVEARDRLAIVTPDGDRGVVADAAERRALHQLATTFGFTHVALEVVDAPSARNDAHDDAHDDARDDARDARGARASGGD